MGVSTERNARTRLGHSAVEVGTDLDVVLIAGRWSLLDRSAERRGVTVIIGGVFDSGLLADPARERPSTTGWRHTIWSNWPNCSPMSATIIA